MPEISRLADTVAILSEGKCLAVGEVEEVMGRLDLDRQRVATRRGRCSTPTFGRMMPHQLTKLAFDGGELLVPYLRLASGERVRVRIRARDVSLALHRPTAISVLNILRGTVSSIRDEEGPIVDVQVAVGATAISARITRRSLQQLGIHAGQEIYTLVKAVSFDQRSVGYAQRNPRKGGRFADYIVRACATS